MLQLHGRDAELRMLVEAYRSACTGRVQYVRISGEPGLGKTRLVQELYQVLTTQFDPQLEEGREGYWPDLALGANTIDSLRPEFPKGRPPRGALPFMWWAISCPAGNEHDADGFSPFLDAMDQLILHLDGIMRAKLVKDAWLETGRSVMEAGLGFSPAGPLIDVYAALRSIWQLGRRQRELKSARDVSSVAGATDIYNGQKPEDMISRMLATLNDAADSKLPSVPLVLVVDDAQWADARSLGFLQRMLDLGLRRGWKLLCISTIRSNELAAQLATRHAEAGRLSTTAAELEHGLLRHAGHDCVTRIELGLDLTRDTMARIIADHLPRAGAEAVARIAGRAGAHPFYAVNYARLVDEEGWLDGQGRLTVGDAELARIPQRVGEVIDRRLRLLDSERLQVLQWGSVMGQKFLDELISHTAQQLGLPRARALSMLGELGQVHQLVTREQKLANATLYGFRHRLIYDRVREGFNTDNVEFALVEDCLGDVLRRRFEAGQLDDWPFEERRSALKWLSEHAVRRAEGSAGESWKELETTSFLAYFETIPRVDITRDRYLVRALQLYVQSCNFASAHALACTLMINSAYFQKFEAYEHYREIAESNWQSARMLDPSLPEDSARYWYSVASRQRLALDWQASLATYEKALACCSPADRVGVLNNMLGIGQCLIVIDREAEAIEIFRQIADESMGVREFDQHSTLYSKYALALLALERDAEGLAMLMLALNHARNNGDLFSEAYVCSNLGVFHTNKEDYERGIEYLSRTISISEIAGSIRSELFSRCRIADTLMYLGRHAEAIEHLSVVRRYFEESEFWNLRIDGMILLCRCYMITGSPDEALRLKAAVFARLPEQPARRLGFLLLEVEACLLWRREAATSAEETNCLLLSCANLPGSASAQSVSRHALLLLDDIESCAESIHVEFRGALKTTLQRLKSDYAAEVPARSILDNPLSSGGDMATHNT